ncbi:uncharacterized protein PV09_05838 [Verruconis gallopava]|uniref:Uncharacterized protein n=1 Tax=Verruconis gallopava TaxID=253628 RepID=A0A0D1XKC0_9PEZI|nr:uncharacterized protein PV09_05838 [Verruconis gallopava]KIW02776.1 hypothetical protein PV09_05838 [Verruconis gallopava]
MLMANEHGEKHAADVLSSSGNEDASPGPNSEKEQDSARRDVRGRNEAEGIVQADRAKDDDFGMENDDSPFEGLGELEAPPPDENPDESRYYRRGSLETTRSESRRRSQSRSKTEPRPSQYLLHLYTYSYLILFSIFGTLARLGTQWVANYANAPVTPSELWANVGGCLVMGFLMEDRALFRTPQKSRSEPPARLKVDSDSSDAEKLNKDLAVLQGELEKRKSGKAHLAYKKTLPLYIGLTVGFCGSYTSFSSAMRDAFLALSNDLTPKNASSGSRNDAWSVCAVVAVIILEVGLSLAALSFGAHLCEASMPILRRLPSVNKIRFLDFLAVFLGFGCWLGTVFLAIWPPQNRWRQDAVFAIVFAPLGCILRFLLSIKLNSLIARFPLGTFVANVFGCMVLAMCYDLQRAPLASAAGQVGGGLVGCQVLQGVIDGFCGCLTTVSTWVAELKGLRKKHAYEYGFASVAVGLSFMIVIIGSLHWTIGLSKAVCTS